MERHTTAATSAILHVTVCAGIGWAAKHYTTLDPFLLALVYLAIVVYNLVATEG